MLESVPSASKASCSCSLWKVVRLPSSRATVTLLMKDSTEEVLSPAADRSASWEGEGKVGGLRELGEG
jgi:hypothetical protein